MLDQLAAEHSIEGLVVVGIDVLFSVEVIDVAFENFAGFRMRGLVIDAAWLAIVTAPHITITQLKAKRGRDLHIGAHFEYRLRFVPGRNDFEGMDKARLVSSSVVFVLGTQPRRDGFILNFRNAVLGGFRRQGLWVNFRGSQGLGWGDGRLRDRKGSNQLFRLSFRSRFRSRFRSLQWPI